jgi:outer membrane protein TolC
VDRARVCDSAMRSRIHLLPLVLLGAVVPSIARAQPVVDPLAPSPGGITAEQVGARALASSYQVQAASALADAASARSDQAWAGFVPRITATGRYTRLSNFTPAALLDLPGQLVGTSQEPGTPNPTPTQAVEVPVIAIPTIIEQYLAQATILIPVSDYFLRIGRTYSAATNAAEAARWDLAGAKTKSFSDGKIAYYTWVRARGAHVVAQQALVVAKAHLHDAEVSTAAGGASRADSLRARTAVAAAELAVERAKNGAAIAERQVRLALHAAESEKIEPGENVDKSLPPPSASVRPLVAEAHAQRPEIKSIDRNAEAARRLASAARAAYYPSLSGFGDVTYANPNPRRFPPRAEWFPTWAAGAQVTWTPTDILGGSASSSDAEARAVALEAQRGAVRDGIELEVMQAHNATNESDVAVATSARQLESATEAYRVARELYAAGRGTSTALTDAETALTQARFENLNARVDSRIARVRLEHAIGRDARAP